MMAGGAFTYNAFLSFRGEDTRYEFTGNLYSALKDRGIHTFIDDEELRGGKEITPSLVSAIKGSMIAIIVLSKNYASSSFCLDELVTILDCLKGKHRLVIPVFYDVDPSDVRKQTGTYGEALAVHDNMERLQKWRMALKQVADLSGYHFKPGNGNYEHKFIAKIVEQVSREIKRVALHVIDHPVGLDSQLQKVISLLRVGPNDGVRVLGIHGIGGIGKTTLAVAIYNWIADHFAALSFEGLCFLENIRENSNKYGLQHLQEILLYELVGEKKIELTSVRQGISMLKQRLQQKKILLILDDVDQQEQLEALAGKSDWFGPGSIIVITTRQISLSSRYEDKITYELDKLNEEDALELLSWKALKSVKVDPSCMDILKDVAAYASGLPLALEVIGSNLVGKSIEQWKSALEQYKRIPNKKIQTILKVSFDDLEEFEKEIFLDIACCFKGNRLANVKEILCAHHNAASLDYVFEVLVEKSLLKIYGYGEVTLHDLIQDMGREIVRQESPNRPGERSRLWLYEDIVQVVENNMGTDRIQILHMDYFPKFKKVIKWDGEAFEKMKNLKTLIIEQAHFSQGPKKLPNSLKVLKWKEYPSDSLPPGFHPEELVMFQLSGWSLASIGFLSKQKFNSLTILTLDKSNIEEIPEVTGVPNLKELSFANCRRLIKIHESVGFLDKLHYLNGESCDNLRSCPPLKLTNLAYLDFSQCSILENFPEILGEMEALTGINWHGTSTKELPSSIVYLTGLRILCLFGSQPVQLPSSIVLMNLDKVHFWACKGLQFPKQMKDEEQGISSKAKEVIFEYCNMCDESLPTVFTWFKAVVNLNLSRNNFTVLPESIQELSYLRSLKLNECMKLREIRGLPPSLVHLAARSCTSLTSSSKIMLLNQELHKGGHKLFYLPGSSIPKWFECTTEQCSISFWFRNKLPDICVCVVAGTVAYSYNIHPKLIINGNEVSSACYDDRFEMYNMEDHVIIFDLQCINNKYNLDEVLSKNEWNHVVCEFTVRSPAKYYIKQIGMHVLKHNSSKEDIQFTNPLQNLPASEMRHCERLCIQGSDSDLYGMELSLRPCDQEPLDCENRKSNIMQSASTCDTSRDEVCSTSSDQGCGIASRKRKRTQMFDLNNELSDSNSFYYAPSKADLNSDSIMLSLAINTANEGDRTVLDHPENVQAPCPTSPSTETASGEELHPGISFTLLTTIPTDKSSGDETDVSEDDNDAEMEALYASLDSETDMSDDSDDDAETEALYASLDAEADVSDDGDDAEMEAFYASLGAASHDKREEAKEALKTVQDFIANNDASVFLDSERCNAMKTSLDYLSNLSAEGDILSGETGAFISEVARIFTHCSREFIEASIKIETSASELLRADELEASLEDNKKRFKVVAAIEKELLQKSRINDNILPSDQSELKMSRKRKRDIFEEGKALKTQMDELREKVSDLKQERDLAEETQAKIKAEWSEFADKMRTIVVE